MIGENIFAWSTSVLLNMYTVSPQISTQNFLDSKTYNWPLVKTTVNHRHQPRCHHSQLYLGRFKESYNEGIKVQVRRTIKNHSFLSPKKRTQALLKFSWTLSTSAQQVSQAPFQNQCLLLLLSPLFQLSG